MTNDQLVLIVGVGVLSLGAMCVGLAAAWYSGRRYAEAAPQTAPPRVPGPTEVEGTVPTSEGELDAPRRSVRDQAVRIVALLFLAAVAVVVAVTGWWPGTAPTIYLLVAAGTLAVVFLGDILPAAVPDGIRGWAEAAVAITFLAALTGLSGGLASPFAAGFYLAVGAGVLSRDGVAPIALALAAGLAAGAVDLIVAADDSPISAATFTAIAFQGVALVLLAAIGAIAGREQRRARDAALRLARFDPLTGLYNRAHFFTELERELRLSQRAGRSFALLMADLDGLKPVNDSFGHQFGDRVLQAVTQVMQHTVRTTDTPARYGGDEFVVLLPDTDAAGAYVVAEKLRRDVASITIQANERTIRTSVSVGLVAYPEDGTTADGLMAAADAALYEAKRDGRDRIVGYTTRTERVATRMGTGERRPAGPTSRGQEPPPPPPEPPPAPQQPPPAAPGSTAAEPPPAAPGSTAAEPPPAAPGSTAAEPPPGSSGPAAPAEPRVQRRGPAPWETDTDPAWDERTRPRVALRVGPDEPVAGGGPHERAV